MTWYPYPIMPRSRSLFGGHRRGLNSVTGALPIQAAARDIPQLRVHQFDHLGQGLIIAAGPGTQQARYLPG
jgi:hypothetical protein